MVIHLSLSINNAMHSLLTIGASAARNVWHDNIYNFHMYQPICSENDTHLLNCSYSTTDTLRSCTTASDSTSVVCLLNGMWCNLKRIGVRLSSVLKNWRIASMHASKFSTLQHNMMSLPTNIKFAPALL